MPKTKAKKPGQQKPARGRPPKGDKPAGAKPRGWANQWGSSRRGDDDGPARPGRNRSRGNTNEPLLKVAKDAEDWGWKHTVAPGTPLCPLYYGCPARPMYFCCERHKALWAGGVQEMERMPPEWKLSAPDPDWAAEFVGGRKMAEEEAKAKAAPSGYRSMGMASFVRGGGDGEEEGEEGEGEEEDGEEGEGEEEEGEEEEEGGGEEEEEDGEEGEEGNSQDEMEMEGGEAEGEEAEGEEEEEEGEEEEDEEEEGEEAVDGMSVESNPQPTGGLAAEVSGEEGDGEEEAAKSSDGMEVDDEPVKAKEEEEAKAKAVEGDEAERRQRRPPR